jgi:hypothetical protein
VSLLGGATALPTATVSTAVATMTQPELIPAPPPKCKDCFRELVGHFSIAYGQCTPCNHAEVEAQLLGFLRRDWRDASPSKRAYIEALAADVQRPGSQ